jgi:hypothetical protein
MNAAEHIHNRVRDLAERDQITLMQAVEIIEALTEPYMGGEEPPHFAGVNEMVHRLVKQARSGDLIEGDKPISGIRAHKSMRWSDICTAHLISGATKNDGQYKSMKTLPKTIQDRAKTGQVVKLDRGLYALARE